METVVEVGVHPRSTVGAGDTTTPVGPNQRNEGNDKGIQGRVLVPLGKHFGERLGLGDRVCLVGGFDDPRPRTEDRRHGWSGRVERGVTGRT